MAPAQEWHRGEFTISTDPDRLDVTTVHGYLTRSYWSPGVSRDVVERSLRGSLPFGIYERVKQVGFGRVVTDRATIAYVADVFVLESHRGRGLSKWLVECMLMHPDLQGLRRWMLATADAHSLYARYGFQPLADPTRFMERYRLMQQLDSHA